MEKKEFRIVFDEISFTNLCKMGFITHNSPVMGRTDIHITKADLRKLMTGEIIEKDVATEKFKFALADLGIEMIKEIIRRSPIYSDIYYEN